MHDRGPGARGLVQDQGDCAERLRLDRQWNQGAYFFYAKHNVRLILCHYNLISNNLSIYQFMSIYPSIISKLRFVQLKRPLIGFCLIVKNYNYITLSISISISISIVILSYLFIYFYIYIPGLRSARPWRGGVPLRDEVELHEQTQGWNKITNMLKLGNKRREEEDEKG